MSNESKFEVGKWYYFEDEASEAAFRDNSKHNIELADAIIKAEGFCPTVIKDGNVYEAELAYGDNMYLTLHSRERKFFTEMDKVGNAEECNEEKCEDVAPSEPSEFPLTKFTISNNSEAWTVYQMLKAHFKE